MTAFAALALALLQPAAEPVTVSSESRALAWVELARVAALNPTESLARMVRKTR